MKHFGSSCCECTSEDVCWDLTGVNVRSDAGNSSICGDWARPDEDNDSRIRVHSGFDPRVFASSATQISERFEYPTSSLEFTREVSFMPYPINGRSGILNPTYEKWTG